MCLQNRMTERIMCEDCDDSFIIMDMSECRERAVLTHPCSQNGVKKKKKVKRGVFKFSVI